MDEPCPVCGQSLDMEPGLYYGTNLVSYSVAVLISVMTLFYGAFLSGSLYTIAAFLSGWLLTAYYLYCCNPRLCDCSGLFGLHSSFLIVLIGISRVILLSPKKWIKTKCTMVALWKGLCVIGELFLLFIGGEGMFLVLLSLWIIC